MTVFELAISVIRGDQYANLTTGSKVYASHTLDIQWHSTYKRSPMSCRHQLEYNCTCSFSFSLHLGSSKQLFLLGQWLWLSW